MHIGRITLKTHLEGIYGPYAHLWKLCGVYLLLVNGEHLAAPPFQFNLGVHHLQLLLYALCHVSHHLFHFGRLLKVLLQAVKVVVGVVAFGLKDAGVHKGGVGNTPQGTVLAYLLVLEEHEVEDILHVPFGDFPGTAGGHRQH